MQFAYDPKYSVLLQLFGQESPDNKFINVWKGLMRCNTRLHIIHFIEYVVIINTSF